MKHPKLRLKILLKVWICLASWIWYLTFSVALQNSPVQSPQNISVKYSRAGSNEQIRENIDMLCVWFTGNFEYGLMRTPANGEEVTLGLFYGLYRLSVQDLSTKLILEFEDEDV